MRWFHDVDELLPSRSRLDIVRFQAVHGHRAIAVDGARVGDAEPWRLAHPTEPFALVVSVITGVVMALSVPARPPARPADDSLNRDTSTSVAAQRISRPRWGDSRLLAGLLLVAFSVLLGVWIVGRSDDRIDVWTVTGTLVPGVALTEADVTLARVALVEAGRYLPGDAQPVGRVLSRPVGAGELLPVAALAPETAIPPTREVAIPIEPERVPSGLARGDLVDVWGTPSDGAAPTGAPTRVLVGVSVVQVPTAEDLIGGSAVSVVVAIEPERVGEVVAALRGGAVDLARVGGS